MTRRWIGRWSTPAGNAVDGYLRAGDGIEHLDLEWHRWPISVVDQLHWIGVIRPAVVDLAQQLLEKPGPAAVVTL